MSEHPVLFSSFIDKMFRYQIVNRSLLNEPIKTHLYNTDMYIYRLCYRWDMRYFRISLGLSANITANITVFTPRMWKMKIMLS